MNYNRISDNLDAIQTSNGAQILAKANGSDPALFGVTLTNGVTYVFPFGADRAPVPSLAQLVSVHMRWDNAIAFTATIEESNFPALWPSDQANGIVDVADHNTTIGNWIQIRPPTAYIEVVGGGSYNAGTGVITVVAAQQGGCTINLSAWGSRRGRVKIIVGATGGLVRFAVNGKAAA